MRKHIENINRAIEIVFYTLFVTVPLSMHPNTSELFEFNKMWLVFGYSLIILFLWGTKILIQRKFEIRRTPFDIALVLFLASQLISTILSMDIHTSFWGYYSRFNGGFLSMLSYIFLYFAFTTNVLSTEREESLKKLGRMLFAIFLSGVLVALWGFPSHFGYDPTCLAFRGELNVSCWTNAFQPKLRMFSTLGQPNWLAAFLLILIPIATAYAINSAKLIKKSALLGLPLIKTIGFTLAAILFYYDMSWTLSQSGFLGFWTGNIIFITIFMLLSLKKYSFSVIKTISQRNIQALLLIQILFVLTTFLTISPLQRLNSITYAGLISALSQPKATTQPSTPVTATPTPQVPAPPALEGGITSSGDIRKIVWTGAIDIWKAYPLFGSGVETYAFAYYKFRPASHNLTTEWDFLYNKAHNEFLNYLATTGIVGLGTYLLFIGMFLFFAVKHTASLWKKNMQGNPLLPALVGGFIGIQVSNFFGFSVVIVNLLMFFIPLIYWAHTKSKAKLITIPSTASDDIITSETPGTGRVMAIIGLGVFCVYCIFFLINYWNADISYALGYNYNRINSFVEANPYLEEAVKMRGGEDLYKNELSVNLAALALMAAQQKNAEMTTDFATRAKALSDEVAQKNPNNVVYWKARTRVMFSLAELSPTVINDAVAAIEKAHALAPTDAKVIYNKALIYDQVGRKEEALKALNEAIQLKANYRDAYYAKALFLTQLAEVNKADFAKAAQYNSEAKEALEFTIKNISADDEQAIELLKTLN